MANREDVTRNKESLMATSETYLGNPDNSPVGRVGEGDIAELVDFHRGRASEFVAAGKYGKALESLEMARDARSGIITTQVEGVEGSTPVLVRDARSCLETPQRGSESAEMQLLNAIRGAIELAEIEGKPELQDILARKAGNLMESFAASCEGLSAAEIQSRVKAQMAVVVGILDKGGVDKAAKKLNTAREFQNFNDTHHDVVTISSVADRDVIEAEVGIRGLTDEQKAEYAAVMDPEQENPGWFSSLPDWHQKLVSKHADTISKGEHTIPTQLRGSIPGMRNASVKITAVKEGDGLEVLHDSMHAGTLAHLGGKSSERDRLTAMNADQAASFIPEGATLHTNTLNSRRPGGDDTEIIDRTTKAMETRGRQTNTAFNMFRYFGFANDMTGATQTLGSLADAVEVDTTSKEEEVAVASIKDALQPRGFFGRIARGFTSMFSRAPSPQDSIDKLAESGKISEEVADILRQGVELSGKVEEASAPLRFGDSENVSLQASTKMNLLTSAMRRVADSAEASAGLNKDRIPKEVNLVMCASGKDRTGLEEHDETAHVVSTKLGVSIAEVDVALLRGGHTGQVAGSVFAGGGTLGCHGTKSENRAGIPSSRAESLDTIVEKSSSGNKIKEPKDKYKAAAEAEVVALEEEVAKAAATTTVAETPEVAAPSVEVAATQEVDNPEPVLGDGDATVSIADAEEDRGFDDPEPELETRSRGGTVTSREEAGLGQRDVEVSVSAQEEAPIVQVEAAQPRGEMSAIAKDSTEEIKDTVAVEEKPQVKSGGGLEAALREVELEGIRDALQGNTAQKSAQFEGKSGHAERASATTRKESEGRG